MSIWKTILGFCLIFLGIFVFGCTEVFTSKSNDKLEVMKKEIVHLDNISQIEQKNDGKLIHINGKATTEEVLTDKLFLQDYNALCLVRNVFYYQWEEVEEEEEYRDKDGEKKKKTHTEYYRGWHSSPINSDRFIYRGHENIAPLRMHNDTLYAQNVQVGAFFLDENQKSAIIKMEQADIKLDQQFLNDFRASTIQRLGRDVNVDARSGEVFIGTGSLDNPNIGDIKIRISIAKPCDVTITGMQSGNRIEAYHIEKDSIQDIRQGTLSVKEYIADIEETNAYGTWGGRISAIIFIVCGAICLFLRKKK